MRMMDQPQAIDRTGHVNIGENGVDVGRSLVKYRQCCVRMFDFDHIEPGVAQCICSHHADEELIFDDNDRGGRDFHSSDKRWRDAGLRAYALVTVKNANPVNAVTVIRNVLTAF